MNFRIANSISDKKKNNLPTKSKLNQRRSDIVGKINFKPAQILDINYNFSYDRDLKIPIINLFRQISILIIFKLNLITYLKIMK